MLPTACSEGDVSSSEGSGTITIDGKSYKVSDAAIWHKFGTIQDFEDSYVSAKGDYAGEQDSLFSYFYFVALSDGFVFKRARVDEETNCGIVWDGKATEFVGITIDGYQSYDKRPNQNRYLSGTWDCAEWDDMKGVMVQICRFTELRWTDELSETSEYDEWIVGYDPVKEKYIVGKLTMCCEVEFGEVALTHIGSSIKIDADIVDDLWYPAEEYYERDVDVNFNYSGKPTRVSDKDRRGWIWVWAG